MDTPQLIALQNISKDLQVNYASMTGIIKSSNSASTLIPYLKIFNSKNELMYTNNKFFSDPTFNYKDIIIDLISADITVGKQGFPSLIEGSLNFRILNQNKMVNPNGTLKNSDLFALLSNININFGWANLQSKFNETCIIEKFDINYSGFNVMDLNLSFGSPLTYLNKVNSALWTKLKDTSKLKTDGVNINPNNNGKIDLLNDEQINKSLSNVYDITNPYNFLINVYDNFLFPYSLDNKYNIMDFSHNNIDPYRLFVENIYITNIDDEKNHYFSKYYFYNTQYIFTPNNSIAFYDGKTNYIDAWYGNLTDLSKTYNSKSDIDSQHNIIYNAIIPKIFFEYKNNNYVLNIIKTNKFTINAFESIESAELNKSNILLSDLNNQITYPTINDFYNTYYNPFYNNINSPLLKEDYSKTIININQIDYTTDSSYNSIIKIYYSNGNINIFNGITISKILDFNDTSIFPTNTLDIRKDIILKINKNIISGSYKNLNILCSTYTNISPEKQFLSNLTKYHIGFIIDLKKIIDKYLNYINSNTNFFSNNIKSDIQNAYNNNNKTIENINSLGIKSSTISIPNYIKENMTITSNYKLGYIDYAILSELNNINKQLDNITVNTLWKNFINNDVSNYSNKNIIDNYNSIYDCLNYLSNIIVLKDFLPIQSYINIFLNQIYKYSWKDIYYTITTLSNYDKNLMSNIQALNEGISTINKENIQNNTAQSIISDYQNSNNTTTLKYIADDLNKKFIENQEKDFLVEIDFFAKDNPLFPNLSDKKTFIIKWDSKLNQYEDTSEKNNNTIELLKNGVHRIENLRIPTHNYNKILEESKSVFDILNGIFDYFRKFNINLMYSIYRHQDTKKTILEIFNIDLISEAVQDWNGDLSFNSISNKLGNGFIVFDYNSLNSIILDLSVNAKTQDSLFTIFMPILDKNALAGLFKNLRNDNKKLPNSIISNVETVFNSVFKNDSDKNTKTFDGQIKLLQQYNNSDELSKKISEKFGTDQNLQNALINLYVINGSYPSHLLFAGYTITLKILGINNFASFQVFGLRNSGLMDGLYIINNVKHYIDKTKFETTIEATLLNPRIGSYKDLVK